MREQREIDVRQPSPDDRASIPEHDGHGDGGVRIVRESVPAHTSSGEAERDDVVQEQFPRSASWPLGNAVRIAGSKAIEYPKQASLHRRERLDGAFDRTVTIPVEIDADRVKAECRDGILALFLTRAERDKPKSIKVT